MSEAAITQTFGSVVPAPGSQEPQVQQEIAVKVQNISQVITTEDALARVLRADGVAVLSEKTVKSHVRNILSKLQLADRTQAAIFAWRQGLMGS
jgi:NarL family two-component system response regulator LiaR